MGMHAGSHNAMLAALEVGGYIYFECTLDDYPNVQRNLVPIKSRRPKETQEFGLTTKLYTAIGGSAGDVRYLVKVERLY